VHRPPALRHGSERSDAIQTVPEFIAFAKANQGKINFASGGNGTLSYVAAELFKMMAGIDMVHVPYGGGAHALTGLLGGQVQVYFSPLAASIEYIRSSKLHALAVTTTSRSEVLPNTPTVDDVVPGYEASGWEGIGAPRNTPADIIAKLNNEINAALTDSGLSRVSSASRPAVRPRESCRRRDRKVGQGDPDSRH